MNYLGYQNSLRILEIFSVNYLYLQTGTSLPHCVGVLQASLHLNIYNKTLLNNIVIS